MPKMTNAIEQFYLYAKEECTMSEELNTVLINDNVKADFFIVCKKFADISLNAPKFKTDDSLGVMGYFQPLDIERAKRAARDFYLKHRLNDIEGYMETIHKLHHLAVEWDDERTKSGLLQSETYNYSHGFMGIYFNFEKLPEDIWTKISDETKEYIQFPN